MLVYHFHRSRNHGSKRLTRGRSLISTRAKLSDSKFRFLRVSVAQPCPTLCDPTDCSPRGSCVHGILQARIPEWVAISFSRGIFPTQGSNPGLWHCRGILSHPSHQGRPFRFLCTIPWDTYKSPGGAPFRLHAFSMNGPGFLPDLVPVLISESTIPPGT